MRFPHLRLVVTTIVVGLALAACSVHQHVVRYAPGPEVAASSPTTGAVPAPLPALASVSVNLVGCEGLSAPPCLGAPVPPRCCWWRPTSVHRPGPMPVASAPAPTPNIFTSVVNVERAPGPPVPEPSTTPPADPPGPAASATKLTKIEFRIDKLLDASVDTPSEILPYVVVGLLGAYILAHFILSLVKEHRRHTEEKARREAGLPSARGWPSVAGLAVVCAAIVAIVAFVSWPAANAALHEPPPAAAPVTSDAPVDSQVAMLRGEVAALGASLRSSGAGAACCSSPRQEAGGGSGLAILIAVLLGFGGAVAGLAMGNRLARLPALGVPAGAPGDERPSTANDASGVTSSGLPLAMLYDVEDLLVPLRQAVAKRVLATTPEREQGVGSGPPPVPSVEPTSGDAPAASEEAQAPAAQASAAQAPAAQAPALPAPATARTPAPSSRPDRRGVAIGRFLEGTRRLRARLEADAAESIFASPLAGPPRLLNIAELSHEDAARIDASLVKLQDVLRAHPRHADPRWRGEAAAALAEARRELLKHAVSGDGAEALDAVR